MPAFAATGKRPLARTTFQASRIFQVSASADFGRVVNAIRIGVARANMRVPSLPGVSASIASPVSVAAPGAPGPLHWNWLWAADGGGSASTTGAICAGLAPGRPFATALLAYQQRLSAPGAGSSKTLLSQTVLSVNSFTTCWLGVPYITRVVPWNEQVPYSGAHGIHVVPSITIEPDACADCAAALAVALAAFASSDDARSHPNNRSTPMPSSSAPRRCIRATLDSRDERPEESGSEAGVMRSVG